MRIDLRSDTITRPTAGMKKAMWEAPLGDDVFGEDPSINALQEQMAHYFNAEAALFCPSGTMTNQIALRTLSNPGEEIICHEYSHIYQYEGGGIMANAGSSVRLTHGARGLISPHEVASLIRERDDLHAPISRVLAVENTMNKGGGACYPFAQLTDLAVEARKFELAYYLDGARLWNALVAQGDDPQAYGPLFDLFSVCLSKGLGCPVGSVLIGNNKDIARAKRWRKIMGGGMRQAGMLAAAGLYALEHHIDRLSADHARAKTIANALMETSWVTKVEPTETNIVIFYVDEQMQTSSIIDRLAQHNVHVLSMGEGKLRMVTHLDFHDAHLSELLKILPKAV